VTRGENSGRSLPQDFVVLEHITSRSENGSWLAELPEVVLPHGARGALVAWVSDSGKLAPLQSLGGWLN
ncbi:MAG: DUF1223 domain-containing protein, partial [Gammaproteobacteria bacterium]|nr:DUF1223 domain-containing protein [Gammaproteobacteria bacterium]